MTYRRGQYNFSKAERITKKEKKKTHRHTAASSDFWKLPLPSFACPNLHHTTHRNSPPHRSPELCVELVNILEPPWATTKGLFFMICPFPPSISDLHHVAGPPFGWMNPESQPTLLLLLRFASTGEWDWSCSFIFYCLDSWVTFLVSSRV